MLHTTSMIKINSKVIFAERLQDLIRENGLNIQKLSDLTGIPRTSISNWLNGRRTVQIEPLVTLALYFKVSTDYLLGIENE